MVCYVRPRTSSEHLHCSSQAEVHHADTMVNVNIDMLAWHDITFLT